MAGTNSKGSVRKILMSGNADAMQGSISDVMPQRAELEAQVDTLLPKDWQDTPFSKPTIDLFRTTVDQIYDPSVPDDHVLDDFAVEAIVIADGSRPVSFIEDGKMLSPMGNGPFIDLMNRQATAIETIGRSVGRLESDVRIAEPWMDGVFYAGSAFVVGPDLAMTNRHVAEIMIRGGKAGSGPFPLNGLWWLNFAGEHGSSARRRFAVLEILWAGPDVIGTGSGLDALDMALLRLGPAEAGDVLPGALTLTLDKPGEGQTVGIVGYPGRPRIIVEKPDDQLACAEEAERALIKVFDNRFGFKRAASGEVDAQPGFDGDVRGWTIRHDVSTLGGNSGSPIFDLGPGRPPRVLALHFGGCTRKTNYGTVFEKLAGDLRRHGALPG